MKIVNGDLIKLAKSGNNLILSFMLTIRNKCCSIA